MSIWFCHAVGVCTNSVNTTNIKSGTSSILVETWFNFAIAMMSQSICYCRCCGNSMSKIFHVFMLRWACGLLVYWEIMILWCVIAMCFCGHSTQFSLWQSPTRLTRNATHSARRATSDFTAIKINVRILGKYINKSDERRCRRQTTTNWNLKFAKQLWIESRTIILLLCDVCAEQHFFLLLLIFISSAERCILSLVDG